MKKARSRAVHKPKGGLQMKAAILTMFTGLSPTYSLVNVAADQIRMLLDSF